MEDRSHFGDVSLGTGGDSQHRCTEDSIPSGQIDQAVLDLTDLSLEDLMNIEASSVSEMSVMIRRCCVAVLAPADHSTQAMT